MGLLNKFLNKSKEARIVTLGVSGAGKTTLIRYLETGEPVTEIPKMTLGIDIRDEGIEIGKWKLSAIDVGGQDLYNNTLWSLGVTQSDAVLYIIDGTTRPSDVEGSAFEESLFSLDYMLSIVSPKIPLLIIINKQDLKDQNPLTVEEAMKLYKLSELAGRSFIVIEGSAKFGSGLDIGFEWMIEKIENRK